MGATAADDQTAHVLVLALELSVELNERPEPPIEWAAAPPIHMSKNAAFFF